MASEQYRYTSNKANWDKTERRILKGSSTNPEVYVDLGGVIELTEEEVEELRTQGANLTKLTDDQKKKLEEERQAAEEAAPRRGSQQQTAPGAQAPAATPEADKRPAAQQTATTGGSSDDKTDKK